MLFLPKIFLASKSPRRKEILTSAGYEVEIIDINVDEDYSSDMESHLIAEYLAIKKMEAIKILPQEGIILTADSIVVHKNEILEKPNGRMEAIQMLSKLSNSIHGVYTGVCLKNNKKSISFTDYSEVEFDELTIAEIEYYVDQFSPYDKAGGYGIQDWIGMCRVKGINGSFYNIKGLPIHKVYENIKLF